MIPKSTEALSKPRQSTWMLLILYLSGTRQGKFVTYVSLKVLLNLCDDVDVKAFHSPLCADNSSCMYILHLVWSQLYLHSLGMINLLSVFAAGYLNKECIESCVINFLPFFLSYFSFLLLNRLFSFLPQQRQQCCQSYIQSSYGKPKELHNRTSNVQQPMKKGIGRGEGIRERRDSAKEMKRGGTGGDRESKMGRTSKEMK